MTIELAPHLRKQLSDLGLADAYDLDRVQKGPRPLPELSSGIAVVRVSGDLLPIRRENEPQLELRFRDVVHAPADRTRRAAGITRSCGRCCGATRACGARPEGIMVALAEQLG